MSEKEILEKIETYLREKKREIYLRKLKDLAKID